MTQRMIGSQKRGGFSLVEILVVIAIIAVLVGLLAVAVAPWFGSQQLRNTKALLKKLDREVAEAYNEAARTFRSSTVPPAIMTTFGCNDATARAIWIKLNLKASFPMSYAEAL